MEMSSLKSLVKNTAGDLFFVILGIFSAAFGFKGFLLTNHFIDGGATGISLLLSAIFGWNFPTLLILVNIPFVVLGYFVMGWQFALKSALSIGGLAFVLTAVHFPNVTNDNLLVAIFGGFFLGAGIGFAMRGNAVIDGTEILAIFLSKKLGMTIGDVVLIINVLIFGSAAYFLGVEIALYSMITYFSASRTLNFVIEGIEEYIGVTIVSQACDPIRDMIVHKLGRGVTVYRGYSGYGTSGERREMNILFTVMTRLEVRKLTREIEKIDPKAFVVMQSVRDTKGGMIKRRPLH